MTAKIAYEKAMKLSIRLEAAVKNVRLLGPSMYRKTATAVLASEDIHKVGTSKSSKESHACSTEESL